MRRHVCRCGEGVRTPVRRAQRSRRNSAALDMSTSSGRKWSISEVSTSPPWMPWRSSSSEYIPCGRPKRCQLVLTASMPNFTRSSRVTMPMISSLPPCDLTTTIFFMPARATDAPSSVQASISVFAGSVNVPGARRCSLDFPTAWTGRMRISISAGSRGATVSIIPFMIVVSVETGRCGPCCSIAATGRTAIVASASIDA